jgi:hypothetical protein
MAKDDDGQSEAEDVQPQAEPKKRRRKTSRKTTTKRKTRSGTRARKTTKPKKHPSVAEILKRDQQIVIDRDVDFLTWTQIAEKHDVTEKTAHEAYERYTQEVAPLFADEDALVRVYEHLRKLEGVQARFARMANNSKNDSAQLGALREMVATMKAEMELRQHIGLLPRNLAQLRRETQIASLGDRIIALFKKHNLPPEAYEELHAIVAPERPRLKLVSNG